MFHSCAATLFHVDGDAMKQRIQSFYTNWRKKWTQKCARKFMQETPNEKLEEKKKH